MFVSPARRVALLALTLWLSACRDDLPAPEETTEPARAVDCARVPDGKAWIDPCGRCVGGSTGQQACGDEDCAGERGGSAQLDACGVCTGGDTGREPCVVDCAGVPGGSATLDACGACVGGDTGLAACASDCAGRPAGTAFVDACGQCVGGDTGARACEADCTGRAGGHAFLDTCGRCVGEGTELEPCVPDCHGDFGGLAFVDACGQCVGGGTGQHACQQDCAAEFGGAAFEDDCGRCVGGSTGLTACVEDCSGLPGGLAFVDGCARCVGGSTGLRACVADCTGLLGGSARRDECNECVGGNTGREACRPDCHGSWGGSAALDECGQCVGGSTGRVACTADCEGTFGGHARVDRCGTCVGGLTGRTACSQDCSGTWGGSAELDRCGQCAGGTSGHTACTQDCSGAWGGLAAVDRCGVCAGGMTGITPCVADCNGTFGGAARVDGCGVCAGGTTGVTPCANDCSGRPGGSAHHDMCQRCVGGDTGRTACSQDCAGQWGGRASTDQCGQCVGGTTGRTACSQDCSGAWGGSAFRDECGQCVGGETGRERCTRDCSGTFGGSASLDECGSCVGGDTGREACVQDCSGTFGGTASVDRCDVCSGGSTGLSACVQDCSGVWGGSARRDACGECVEGTTGLEACVPGECRVGRGYPSVQSAINDSRCQVVVLQDRRYDERLQINRSVVLRGTGRDQTTLHGQRAGTVIGVSGASSVVRLENLTVQGGQAQEGAGIMLRDADLSLDHVRVFANEAVGSAVSTRGAGIATDGGKLTLRDSIVDGNGCESCDGAGIHANWGTEVTLTDSAIESNEIRAGLSYVKGAGLHVFRGSLRATNTRFVRNFVTGSVRGFYGADGGALRVEHSPTELENCVFEDNRMHGDRVYGAALSVYGSVQLHMRGGAIRGNDVRGASPFGPDGGGIISLYATEEAAGTAHFEDVAIVRNELLELPGVHQASITPGALMQFRSLNGPFDVELWGVQVRENVVRLQSSSLQGGLVNASSYRVPTRVRFVASDLSANQISADALSGGLLHAENGGRIVLDRSLASRNVLAVTSNFAAYNEGLLGVNDGSILVQNSTLDQNTITGRTYALASVARTSSYGGIAFVNATVTDNVATGTTNTSQPLSGERFFASHSVFAGNTVDASHRCDGDAYAATFGGHHNWFDNAQRCELPSDAHSVVGQAPRLAPLADHGGPTWSRAPLPDSPLIDAGDATCSSSSAEEHLDLDQRGLTRPAGDACDLGSVEVQH